MEREVLKEVRGSWTVDGAGVKLVRVLEKSTAVEFDPFLMLDSFDSENYDDYKAGFPMHPHRGIETVTYLSEGAVIHEDSMGNKKEVVGPGVQWMNTGSGIMHSEMFDEQERLLGVQLWLNIPAAEKMTNPSYIEVGADLMSETAIGAANIRVYAGSLNEAESVKGEHLPLDFYAIELEKNKETVIPTKKGYTTLLFSLKGNFNIAGTEIPEKTCVNTSDGTEIKVEALCDDNELLWFAAPPTREMIAWGGPIVMSTKEDLKLAFEELSNGTFLK